MSRPLRLAFALSFLLSSAVIAQAQDSGLPEPFSPWLENKPYPEEYKRAYLPEGSQDATRILPNPREEDMRPPQQFEPSPRPDGEPRDYGAEPEPAPSALENLYSSRAGQPLRQFGYDLFGADQGGPKTDESNAPPLGAVQEDFILGVGDELQITFSGQRTDQQTYKINSEGMILIKDLAPIPAAGRPIGEIREVIARAVSTLPNTQAYVSLSSVRQVGVLIVGHVENPGRRNLTVFHTVLDALNAGGGIQKTGSLRKIKLVRQGRSNTIDLYGLLLHGGLMTDMRLQDGDRIIVPPVGPTVAIAGDVNRPGIYEILPGYSQTGENGERLSLQDMLNLAGGILVPGQNRFMRLDLDKDGRENVTEIENTQTRQFGYGAILQVLKSEERRSGMVELAGHVRKPGLHDLTRNRTLSTLLDSPDILGRDIYPLIGVIERWDQEQLSTQYLDFSVRSVFNKKNDFDLKEGDRVILFSKSDIYKLNQQNRSDLLQIENTDYPQLSALASTGLSPDSTALRSFLKEHGVTVQGAVRTPAIYPIAEGVTLDQILAVSGGLTMEADSGNVEITGARSVHAPDQQPHRNTYNLNETPAVDIPVRPGDSIRIKEISRNTEERTVMIRGEVRNPGPYDILPDDRISDLIERAGGLTDQAYPEGAVFSRDSQRRAEKGRYRSTAQEMKRSIAAAVQQDKNAPDAGQIQMARELADELETVEPLGRITVEADPEILTVKPELDMLLEAGDRLYIPKRPLTVRVDGEVLSPASLQFRRDKDPGDYIREAGGFTYHADKGRSFVIYPDGSAQPLKASLWNHDAVMIPPGSTIVVPRDPKPFDFIESAKDVSQILSNLAITSIFIDDIRD